MKKKKTTAKPENESIRQWRKNFALGKRKDARAKQKEDAELERQQAFERKKAAASDKKAPVTLRTKAYYRFTAEYPSSVDENGFRENSPSARSVLRRRIVTAAVCILVFAAAFIVTRTGMLISASPLPEHPTQAEEDTRLPFRALHFTYDEFSEGDIPSMCAALEEADCNAAVFEFKDDDGYVLFNTGSFMGMSADKRIATAYETVKAIKAEGYTVCAYISCFCDSAASRADLTYSVRKNTFEGDAWLDNSGKGWLDPFSGAARDYLLRLISAAAENGFDRIFLNNVCFSADSGTAQQCYAWEEESDLTRNQALLSFIGSAVKSAGSARLTVMCDMQAFRMNDGDSVPRYYGTLLTGTQQSVCADARLTVQQKNITIGEQTFSDASLMPYVFVSAVSEYAVQAVRNDDENDREILVCVEKNASLEDELAGIGYSGANGYLIW